MTDSNRLGPWVRRFLLEHLIDERNLSRGTQRSYRDTLALLIPFVARQNRKGVDALNLVHVSADCIRRFLAYVEESRNCAVSTRNQRLAAIHSLARFVGLRSPEHLAWCGEICTICNLRATRQRRSKPTWARSGKCSHREQFAFESAPITGSLTSLTRANTDLPRPRIPM
jgi:integrase/recombinase XerD